MASQSPGKRVAFILAAVALINADSTATAGDNKKAPLVSPVLEVSVIDPGVDSKGNPKVVLKKSVDGDGQTVEIPPTLVVHKYYFTGKRTFQGPMLPGGPAIAVYNHPKTNEQVKVPLQLLPGAPKVHYTEEAIEYEYGKHSIVIKTEKKKPVVEYRNSPPVSRRVGRVAHAAGATTKEVLKRTYVPDAAKAVATSTRDFTLGTIDFANEVGKRAMTPVCNAIGMLPLAKPVQGAAEDLAIRKRTVEIQRAAEANASKDVTIRTNR